MGNNQKNVLIVGQGLAGSILAFELLQANFNVKIFDAPSSYFKSSMAAGGLFNPVTGRKLEQTWLADELFSYLFTFYPNLENILGKQFFHPMPLFRPFANDEMKNWLMERKREIHHRYLDWRDDGVFIHQTGWVDVAQMLEAFELFFNQHQYLYKEAFDVNQMDILSNQKIVYKSEFYDYILFCEGFHAQKNNPFFKQLCFLPAKGELLHIETVEADETFIISKNGFLLPIGNHQFKVGATYSWDDLSEQPRPNALEELNKKVGQFSIENYQMNKILVGVRPATQDRRPFVGLMPQKNIGIFNGFGSKGVSLIPYFAKQFVGNLLNQNELNPEVSIHRFSHLFSI